MDDPQQVESAWKKFARAPATWALLVANVIMFLIVEANGGSTDTETLVRFGASCRGHIWEGEIWRFLTPVFLHIGVLHLLVNSFFMFGWNSMVERTVGTSRFLLAYLLTAVAASAASVLLHDTISAGASGAGFGMIGMVLYLLYASRGSWSGFLELPGVRQTLFMLVIWTVLGFTALPMDNWAHLGGFAAGVTLAFLYRQKRAWIGVAGFVVILTGVVIAAAIPWEGRTSGFHSSRFWKKGNQAMDKREPDRAIEMYTLALRYGGEIADLYYNRGLARENADHHADALDDYRHALRLNPEHDKAHWVLGHLLAERGEDRDALHHYNEAVRHGPRNPDLLEERAALRRRLGDDEGADKDLEEAKKLRSS